MRSKFYNLMKTKSKSLDFFFFIKFQLIYVFTMILIPCPSVHWSLVIVCIPDKEDESGLTILHLDSLGVHPKRSIVENVKRYGTHHQELYLFTCLSFLCICSFNTLMERHICQTLCRFLKDEWNFLNQDDDYSSNLPISAKLWRNLPRRINEADIKVRSFTFKSPIFPCEI